MHYTNAAPVTSHENLNKKATETSTSMTMINSSFLLKQQDVAYHVLVGILQNQEMCLFFSTIFSHHQYFISFTLEITRTASFAKERGMKISAPY